jgi:hypothetical protein
MKDADLHGNSFEIIQNAFARYPETLDKSSQVHLNTLKVHNFYTILRTAFSYIFYRWFNNFTNLYWLYWKIINLLIRYVVSFYGLYLHYFGKYIWPFNYDDQWHCPDQTPDFSNTGQCCATTSPILFYTHVLYTHLKWQYIP